MVRLFSIKMIPNVKCFVLFIVLFSVICIILNNQQGQDICWATDVKNCRKDNTSDIISLGTEEPTQPSIILLEGYGNPILTPRMWCAIESAAVAHSNISVFVFMTSNYTRETPVMQKVIAKYENIKIVHLNSSKLFNNSLLQTWFLGERWKISKWPKEHYNDILRWMILWKYGGVYLDLDVVVTQGLMHLGNFAGLESDDWVGAGLIGFTKEHPIVIQCLKWIRKKFNGKVWGANGPRLLTKALKRRCGLELPSGATPKCSDVKIYPKKTFYPIPWWQWSLYIKEDIEYAEKVVHDPETFAIHVWNYYTQSRPVMLYQTSPYAVAASYYCPIVVYEVGFKF